MNIKVFRVKGVDFMLIIAWRLCLDEMASSLVCWIRIRSLLFLELPLDLEIDRASDYEPGKILARRIKCEGGENDQRELSIRAEWSSIGFPFRVKAAMVSFFVVEKQVLSPSPTYSSLAAPAHKTANFGHFCEDSRPSGQT